MSEVQITKEFLRNICNSFGYFPKEEYLSSLFLNLKSLDKNSFISQFLANLIYESRGLQKVEEIEKNKEMGNFYGRGFFLLSWEKNYREISLDLFKNDTLIKNPDKIISDVNINIKIAIYLWKKLLKNKEISCRYFINSCNGLDKILYKEKDSYRNIKKYEIYKKIEKELNKENTAEFKERKKNKEKKNFIIRIKKLFCCF